MRFLSKQIANYRLARSDSTIKSACSQCRYPVMCSGYTVKLFVNRSLIDKPTT